MFSQKGQVLLIVILVIIISSTIGLSLASRSITSIRTSTEEAESQKALSAAEAGIERALQGLVPIALPGETNLNPDGTINSKYSTTVNQVDGSSFLINGGSPILDATGKIINIIPNTIPKDEGADVWFVKHDTNGNPDYSSVLSPQFLNLYWGSSSEACDPSTAPAAIQVIVVTRKSAKEIKTHRYAYDSCSRGNNFTPADDAGNFTIDGAPGITFKYKTPNNDLAKGVKDIVFVRVIPLYKDTAIGIDTCNPSDKSKGCTILPPQGYVISSTGTSGQANHKITVFEGYPQTYLPYLSYGLFVPTSF